MMQFEHSIECETVFQPEHCLQCYQSQPAGDASLSHYGKDGKGQHIPLNPTGCDECYSRAAEHGELIPYGDRSELDAPATRAEYVAELRSTQGEF